MSATEIPSGRGRLRMPGMGQTLGDPAAEPQPSEASADAAAHATDTGDTAEAAPKPRRQRDTTANGANAITESTSEAAKPRAGSSAATKRNAKTLDGPYAGEKKAQVNPRIYPSIWSYYEDLVDELPRHQRHGALTALVNAVLARHAPASSQDALELIQWLRQAETRERPA